jgi:hypothetical protein
MNKKKKSWNAASDEKRIQDPHNLSYDNTTDVLGSSSGVEKKSGRNYGLIKSTVERLKRKFRNAHHWIYQCRTDGSMAKVPATVRGNQTYAYYQNKRIKQIQDSIKDKIRIENCTTNALFITLTQQYDCRNIEEIEKTWTKARPALKRYKEKLRKMGIIDYVDTLEAHENGGCHIHMIAIFGESMKIHATKGDKYRVNNIEILYKIKKAWADALGYDMDSAFVDVLACGNTGLVGYITKELKKTASCEQAIRNAEANKDTPSDRKKMLAFYLADKYKMRLLHVSKGISAEPEPEEGETPEADLITNVITDTDRRPKVLFSILVTRKELLQHMAEQEISPFTGEIDRITKEYEVMIRMFDEKCELSRILGNKEEIERIVKERNERKMTRVQTKIIAQKAMNA